MDKFSETELEDIRESIVYSVDEKKFYCPRCSREIEEVKEFNLCSDDSCGWRQYIRKNNGEKYYGGRGELYDI